MDAMKRRELIERYRMGYRIVADALRGVSPAELDSRPASDKWSAREIVHHLADTEMDSAIRLRRLVVEERPHLHNFDQDAFARHLFYDRPYEASLNAFRYARETTAEILDRLSPDQWTREGIHSELPRYSVERWLELHADHAHRHAEQIKTARAAANR